MEAQDVTFFFDETVGLEYRLTKCIKINGDYVKN